jgi:hypothetical protein
MGVAEKRTRGTYGCCFIAARATDLALPLRAPEPSKRKRDLRTMLGDGGQAWVTGEAPRHGREVAAVAHEQKHRRRCSKSITAAL